MPFAEKLVRSLRPIQAHASPMELIEKSSSPLPFRASHLKASTQGKSLIHRLFPKPLLITSPRETPKATMRPSAAKETSSGSIARHFKTQLIESPQTPRVISEGAELPQEPPLEVADSLEALPEGFEQFMNEEIPEDVRELLKSESREASLSLSSLAGKSIRVTHLDVLRICLKLYQLLQKDRENEKRGRFEERDSQKRNALSTSESYRGQGNAQLGIAIVGGFLTTLAGALPLIGQMKGDWIIDKCVNKLGWTSLQNLENGLGKVGAFKSLSQTIKGMADAANQGSHVYTSFSEGGRQVTQLGQSLAREQGEDCTREADLRKDHMRGIEQYINQLFQNLSEVSRRING